MIYGTYSVKSLHLSLSIQRAWLTQHTNRIYRTFVSYSISYPLRWPASLECSITIVMSTECPGGKEIPVCNLRIIKFLRVRSYRLLPPLHFVTVSLIHYPTYASTSMALMHVTGFIYLSPLSTLHFLPFSLSLSYLVVTVW
jgi:hypothetical protein